MKPITESMCWDALKRDASYQKEFLIQYCNNSLDVNRKNRMGCNENWYNPFYAIKETFSQEEINSMSCQEVENLLKLGNAIGEGLY